MSNPILISFVNYDLAGTAFEFGNLLFGGYAYFIRNERDLQLVTFAPVILFLIPLAFLKESARWLISKGHVEEAKEILRHAAKVPRKLRTFLTHLSLTPK